MLHILVSNPCKTRGRFSPNSTPQVGINVNHLNAQSQTPLTVAQMNKQEAGLSLSDPLGESNTGHLKVGYSHTSHENDGIFAVIKR